MSLRLDCTWSCWCFSAGLQTDVSSNKRLTEKSLWCFRQHRNRLLLFFSCGRLFWVEQMGVHRFHCVQQRTWILFAIHFSAEGERERKSKWAHQKQQLLTIQILQFWLFCDLIVQPYCLYHGPLLMEKKTIDLYFNAFCNTIFMFSQAITHFLWLHLMVCAIHPTTITDSMETFTT